MAFNAEHDIGVMPPTYLLTSLPDKFAFPVPVYHARASMCLFGFFSFFFFFFFFNCGYEKFKKQKKALGAVTLLY